MTYTANAPADIQQYLGVHIPPPALPAGASPGPQDANKQRVAAHHEWEAEQNRIEAEREQAEFRQKVLDVIVDQPPNDPDAEVARVLASDEPYENIAAVVCADLPVDQKMRKIMLIHSRAYAWTSQKWADLLHCYPPRVRCLSGGVCEGMRYHWYTPSTNHRFLTKATGL